MPYGGVTNSAADLNQIPTALVERVEVLTGGASAVYGSDAIAGVVNFIMKKDFEGVQIDGQYSLYQHNNDFSGPGARELRDVISGRAATNPSQFALPDDNVTDGNSVQGTITIGVSTDDGRGNITAYASYQDNKEVSCSGTATSRLARWAASPTSAAAAGSFTAFPGRFTDFGSNSNATTGPDRTLAPQTSSGQPLVAVLQSGGHRQGHVPEVRQCDGSVQLRSGQSLPASGHPLQPRRNGPLRAG